MDYNQLISCFLDIGELMLVNGAEVSRVEDTLSRICSAYHFQSSDTHAINSSIIMTVHIDEQIIITQARRIGNINTNFHLVELCNELSRDICCNSAPPALPWLKKRISFIKKQDSYPFSFHLFGWILATFSFSFFFSGGWLEALVSSIIALIICLLQYDFNSIEINKIVENIVLSAVMSILAFTFSIVFPTLQYDIVIISNIMLLIPGLSFCNGIKSMTVGDTISGILTLCDALLRAFAIGLGYTIIIMLERVIL